MSEIKWEYRMRTVRTFREGEQTEDMLLRVEAKLNTYGIEGWEAVNIWYDDPSTYILFKRPVSK
jgi:hypothetical protein